MKKILAIALSAFLLTGLVGCSSVAGGNSAPPSGVTTPEGKDVVFTGPMEDIMDKLLTGVSSDIKVMNEEIAPERFSWFFGIEPIGDVEAFASEAMINITAHSVSVLRLPEGTDVEKTAAAIEEKLDPRKWICVSAEENLVKHKGNLILVVQSYKDIADVVVANFDKLQP